MTHYIMALGAEEGDGQQEEHDAAKNLLSRAASALAVTASGAITEAGHEVEELRREKQEWLARRTEKLLLEEGVGPSALNTYEGRLETFSLVWKGAITGRSVCFAQQSLLPLTIERLSWAGLYYHPDCKIEDRTVCYTCGKALHSWAPCDDPLYEHCKVNADCPHVQMLLEESPDLGSAMLRQEGSQGDATTPAKLDRESSLSHQSSASSSAATPTPAPAEPKRYDWTGITEDWPADSVIDHLLLVVHGIGTNDDTLPTYVETLRRTFEPSWQRKYVRQRQRQLYFSDLL